MIPLGGDRPDTYAAAVEHYLRSAGISESSRRIYRISLTTWTWLATGQQPPLGRDRRGATPPALPFAALADPAAADALADAFAARAVLVDPNTVNRELSVFKAAPPGGAPAAGSPPTPSSASNGGRRRPTAPGPRRASRSPRCSTSKPACARRRCGGCSTKRAPEQRRSSPWTSATC
jgi:hypothetical protein